MFTYTKYQCHENPWLLTETAIFTLPKGCFQLADCWRQRVFGGNVGVARMGPGLCGVEFKLQGSAI